MKSLKDTYKKSLLLFSIVLLSCTVSCKKFVQIPDAPNKLPTSAIFADSTDATSAVLGMYSSLMEASGPAFINGEITINTSLASDELYPSNSSSSFDVQYYTNAIDPTSLSLISDSWQFAYAGIYQANACIEGLTSSVGLSNSAKSQLLGEAKLFRALNYFYLTNLFGQVPIETSTSYQVNASSPRSDTAFVYRQIISDLTSADSLLSTNYPSAGRVRPNKYTAAAFLAKVYLYQQQWAKAEASTTQVINSGVYNLEPVLNNVFLAGSKEAIWQLIPLQSGFETKEGYTFIPGNGFSPPAGIIPAYSISNYLLTAFENGDQRKLSWLDTVSVSGTTYYYPNKYKLAYDGSTVPLEDYMVLRLGEQYLIRAEAEAQLGDGNAINDLNVIRNRAGLPNYTGATDKTSLLNAIYQERRIELFCELGNRWFDLKRTGNVNMVMGTDGICKAKGGTWNSNWQLFPIPFSQLSLNPFLRQNPGY